MSIPERVRTEIGRRNVSKISHLLLKDESMLEYALWLRNSLVAICGLCQEARIYEDITENTISFWIRYVQFKNSNTIIFKHVIVYEMVLSLRR